MEIFSFLAAFLLIRRIQKTLKNSTLYVKWGGLLNGGMWITVAAYALVQIYLNDVANILIGSAYLLAIIIFIDRESDFLLIRNYSRNHYPLIAAGFISGITELINSNFYDNYESYFQFAVAGAFVWIFARWSSSKKQMEEFRVINERNTQLDYLVAQRTAELTNQKTELEHTLQLLQNTQLQLIQSEKLASLGELTAGIAHEIQNPLNFVNNFSEVSVELIDEMEQELLNGDKDEAIAIAADIKQNLDKIRHHGKRADNIVKGMLQHSRAGSNVKEPANINALADEYLRLAYYGLRAKDKSFNAELVINLDSTLPVINIVPQDIGRVLLNLFNNAFYAVQSRQKTDGENFKPVVEITTKLHASATDSKEAIITIKDNGTGIPDDIKDKILQPFFTTKPTGEGTGLGLSLSYDIIVKGHGGSLDVESKENEFTAFIIKLPL